MLGWEKRWPLAMSRIGRNWGGRSWAEAREVGTGRSVTPSRRRGVCPHSSSLVTCLHKHLPKQSRPDLEAHPLIQSNPSMGFVYFCVLATPHWARRPSKPIYNHHARIIIAQTLSFTSRIPLPNNTRNHCRDWERACHRTPVCGASAGRER